MPRGSKKRKKRIKPTEIDQLSKRVKPIDIGPEWPILFNFKHLYCSHEKFDYSECEPHYFHSLLKRFKDISPMTREQLTKAQVKKTLRFHPIDFHQDRVSEENFGLGDDIGEDAWQFSLSRRTGRIHGFFVENVFYIVWLDPGHKLYPGK